MTLARRISLAVAFAVAVTVVVRPASAQEAAIEQARAHFDAGQRLYEKSEFAKAAEEFMTAYGKKAFPAFLFNAAACHESLKEYNKAIDLLERYLREDPKAADRAEVEQWISSLKASRTAAAAPPPPPIAPAPGGATPESTTTAPPPPPVRATTRTKGLTVVETYPEGATIRVDSEGAPELGKTTWSGQLPDGKHTLYLGLRGFKTEQKTIMPSGQVQFAYYFFRLSEDPEFGFLVVTSNIADALIYMDRQPGIWGRVSSERNLKKGMHHIQVVREGYQAKELDVDIKAGQLNTIPVQLEQAKTGFLRVRSNDAADGVKVQVDDKEVCGELPCRLESPEGDHKVVIMHKRKKTYARTVHLERFTESTLTVKLADKPSRAGAIGWFLAAGVSAAGGVLGGLYLNQSTASTFGIPDNASEVRIGYFAAGGLLTAAFLYFGIADLVRDKGPASSGALETRDLTWIPMITPQLQLAGAPYSGAGATWRF